MILDAQFPHKSPKTDKYICSYKIADPSCNICPISGTIDYCTLVMFASKYEDLPVSQRIGDIIRVHRASVSTFNDAKQITANVFFNSSWALFSSNPKVPLIPFSRHGKKELELNALDKKTLGHLKKWVPKTFSKH